MFCPFCQDTLEKSIFYGVEVDYCPSCLGLWFEQDELRLAKDKKDENLNWLDIDLWEHKNKFKISRDNKLCPSCRLPFYEINYGESQVKTDVCNVCYGIWLDRGEFKNIIGYLRERKDYEIFNNFSKNLIAETWEILTGPETLKEELSDFMTILKILNYKFLTKYPIIVSAISALPK